MLESASAECKFGCRFTALLHLSQDARLAGKVREPCAGLGTLPLHAVFKRRAAIRAAVVAEGSEEAVAEDVGFAVFVVARMTSS